MSIRVHHADYKAFSAQVEELDREDLELVLQPANRFTFIGTVVRWDTKAVIPEFSVRGGSNEVEKDPALPGRFIAENLSRSSGHYFDVEAEGFVRKEVHAEPPPEGEELSEATVELGAGGRVKGRVVEAETGRPIPEVRVAFQAGRGTDAFDPSARASGATVTDADGYFQSIPLHPGPAAVIVYAPKPYVDCIREARLEHGKESDLGEIVLGEGGSIRGRVVRKPGGEGVAEGEVTLFQPYSSANRPTARIDFQGAFEFANLVSGYYSLTAYPWNLSVERIEVKGGQATEVTLDMGRAVFKGQVLRAGQPVKAQLRLTPPSPLDSTQHRTGFTDAEGRFEFADLTAGRWQMKLTVTERFAQTLEEAIDIPGAGTVERTFDLSLRRITGLALGADGSPLIDATVKATLTNPQSPKERTTWTAVTSLGGRFVFSGIPAGVYTVTLEEVGATAASVEGVSVPEEGESGDVLLHRSE